MRGLVTTTCRAAASARRSLASSPARASAARPVSSASGWCTSAMSRRRDASRAASSGRAPSASPSTTTAAPSGSAASAAAAARRDSADGTGNARDLVHADGPAAPLEAGDDLAVVAVAAGPRVEAPRHHDVDSGAASGRVHQRTGPSYDAQATCDSCSVTRADSISPAVGPSSPRPIAWTMRSKRPSQGTPSSCCCP